MTPEVRKYALNQPSIKVKNHAIGRNRFLALSLAGLLLSGCNGGLLTPAAIPTPEPTLTPDQTAQICNDSFGLSSIRNPDLSEKEEHAIHDLVFQIEGPKNFPSNPQAAGMTLYDQVGPTISPDHTKIAYSSILGHAITVINRDGTNSHALTTPPQGDIDQWASWSLDGKRIAFERWSNNNNTQELRVVGSDGSNETQITAPIQNVIDKQPLFLNNGKILFSREDNRMSDDTGGYFSDTEILTVNHDGTDLKEIPIDNSDGHYIEGPLIPSPDHSLVAFQTHDSAEHFTPVGGGYIGEQHNGQKNLPISVYDSKTEKIYPIDQGKDFSPFNWSKDGKYLRYYQYEQNGKTTSYIDKIYGGIKYACPSKQS